jgi:hypothetical protein
MLTDRRRFLRQHHVVTDEPDFAQQYLADTASLEMPIEDRLALWYHIRCECHDRAVCSVIGPDGVARPANSAELTIVNRFADDLRRQLAAAHPELQPGRLWSAISHYGRRYSHNQMIRMLAHLDLTNGAHGRDQFPSRALVEIVLGLPPIDIEQVRAQLNLKC